MNHGRSGRKQLKHRLKNALVLMGSIFLIALGIMAWQGGVSLRGVGRGIRGPNGQLMPLAFGHNKASEAPSGRGSEPTPAGPLVTPKQAWGQPCFAAHLKHGMIAKTQTEAGASRWSSALLKVMPPFTSWMPPEAVAKAVDALHPTQAQQSAPQYTFPDALPKVALLFLTRLWLPYESVWKAFLNAVPALGEGRDQGWQQLFSLHVHLPPNHFFNGESLFKGREVEERVAVEWGQWSVVEAELILLRAALVDPRNQRFVLLSETCVPLYPAAVVWAQLMGESRSRLNACANPFDPNDPNNRMEYRWSEKMEGPRLKREHWRKSAQWFALTAEHAKVMVSDVEVAQAFREHCWVDSENINKGWAPRTFCPADEHYFPTLLASLGRQNETDCTGLVTAVWWEGPYFHPKEFQEGEITPDLITDLRMAKPDRVTPKCNAAAALASSSEVLPSVRRELGEVPEPAELITGHHQQMDKGRRLREQRDADMAGARWIAQLRLALDPSPGRLLGESPGGARGGAVFGGRALLQQGRPKKGQETEQGQPAGKSGPAAPGGSNGAWTDLAKGSGDFEEGLGGEMSDAEAATVAELLALADAVRGDSGGGGGGFGGSGVDFVQGQEEAVAALAKALEPKFHNDTASWSADSPNQLVRALLANYSPLGSSSCPLFARKFGEPARGAFEQMAGTYLAPEISSAN